MVGVDVEGIIQWARKKNKGKVRIVWSLRSCG